MRASIFGPTSDPSWKANMVKSVGHDAQHKRLGFCQGVWPRCAIDHDAGQIRHLGDPASVVFSLDVDLHVVNLQYP